MKLNINKIKSEMEKQGITGYELAKRIRVAPQWVYVVLKNHKSHTLRTIDKIAKGLCLDPKDLIE